MSTPKLAIPDLTQTAGLTAYLSCNEGFIKLDAFLHGCTIKDRDRTIPPNETQTLTITGTPTGGTFTLLYVDQTTSAIAYNASAATVDAALEALSNIGAGDVTCAGGPLPGTPVTIQFTGALAGGDRALLVPNTAGLTGGTVPAATVTTTTPFAVAGDLYLVAASPTGDWTGKAGKIALFGAVGTWYFIDPIEGMEIWVQDEDLKLYYDGAAWVQAPYKRVAADVDITDSSGGTASHMSTDSALCFAGLLKRMCSVRPSSQDWTRSVLDV